MAAAVRVIGDYDLGGGAHLYIGELDLDASYPSGGYAIDLPANQRIEVLLTDDHGGVATHWDRGTQKLLVQQVGAALSSKLSEIGAGTSLATVTKIPFIAVGI